MLRSGGKGAGVARWAWAAGLSAALALVPVGCGHAQDEARAAAAVPPSASAMTIPGQLEAADGVYVTRRSQTWAFVRLSLEKIVPEGTVVKEGDFLFQIDSTETKRAAEEVEAAVKTWEVSLTGAESSVVALRSQMEAARDTGPARLAPYVLAVQRLRNLPDPVDLADAESQLATRRAVLAEARTHCEAVEALAAQDLASQQALIEARFSRDIAAAEVEYAEAKLEEVEKGAAPYDVAIAEEEEEIARVNTELQAAELAMWAAQAEIGAYMTKAQLESQRKQLATARREVELGTRYAPVGGMVVYERVSTPSGEEEKVGPGATIAIMDPVVSIISGKAFRFRGKASEALLGRIRVGLPARIRVEALPDAVLTGHVEAFDVSLQARAETVEPLVDLESPKPKVFDVLITVDDVPAGLMPGLSGEAEIEKGTDEGGSLAPGTSSAGTRAAVDDRGAGGGPALKLPGYVDALEKRPIFTPADVMGYITQIVPQYARVEEGDVVLESTGDRARATLEEVADTPELAQGRLKVAKTALDTDVTRRELARKGADLEVKAAELRLAKLESLPREPSVKMAEAKVRRAELELARAGQLLEVARAAGLYSEHDLERKEVEARLAELQLEEEKVRLALVRKGAAKEDLERARFGLDYARQEVAHVERRSAQWAELLNTLYAEAEVGLANGLDVVQEFQRRLDQRILRAPVAGNVVLEPLDRARGRTLARGDYLPQWPLSVGHVCDLAKLKFCAVVEQTDLSHIEVGDKASVELLAIPARSFQGTVSAVMPLVIDREEVRTPDTRPPKLSGVRSTRVDILLDVPEDGNTRILPGMTGTATLLMRGSAA